MPRGSQETRPRNLSYRYDLTPTPQSRSLFIFVRLFFCLKTFANLRFTFESGIDTHKVIEIVSRRVIIAPMRHDQCTFLDTLSCSRSLKRSLCFVTIPIYLSCLLPDWLTLQPICRSRLSLVRVANVHRMQTRFPSRSLYLFIYSLENRNEYYV